ncbi:hypothetical protein ONZ51_g11191 [Trametes cubensis]|uniref:Uncharacterized protein n=1 Tax=Trametes cubensis TaxID=1111947 RepID=A0AAD7TI12_9APHY|nr:hypothetical protein ONZ51_g11191 [Trametes cubensis]
MADPETSSKIVYSPSPGSYAVIRLNPVAMVEPLGDYQALLQARSMRPKLYLVCLYLELALPWPDQPWYKFDVQPIATSLRPGDKARCISSEMCIPVFPNTNHPNGRELLRPQPESLFPYDNCYHWFDMKARIRIRARPEEFDETNAVALSVRSRMQMSRSWDEDGLRMSADQRALQAARESPRQLDVDPNPPSCLSLQTYTTPETHDIHDEGVPCGRADASASRDSEDVDHSSFISESGPTTASEANPTRSIEAINAMGIFTSPDDDADLLPLVDLWISELADHLKQEDIPSPLEMFAEFDEIVRIVAEARVRSYIAMTAPALSATQHGDSDESCDTTAELQRKLVENNSVGRTTPPLVPRRHINEPNTTRRPPTSTFNLRDNITFCPSPGSYAVIRLDPVAMVQRFDDPQALLQAQAMRPKSYLVYLVWDLALPFPDQPWYAFEIQPIAPSLRSEDKAQGITFDMCTPIFPNTHHPTGREPLRPEPEGLFPYDNCYHWFNAKACVRVLARPESFDETSAVALDIRTDIRMMRHWEEDGARMFDNRARFQSESGVEHRSPVNSETLAGAHISPERENTSCTDSASTSESHGGRLEGTSTHSLEDVAAMGIFSGPDADMEVVPLVDLWISELQDHLKQEDIPSPLEMYAEFEHIAKIVQDARIRSYAAMTAAGSPESRSSVISNDLEGSLNATHDYYDSSGLRSVRLTWRRLRAQAKQIVSRLKRALSLQVPGSPAS